EQRLHGIWLWLVDGLGAHRWTFALEPATLSRTCPSLNQMPPDAAEVTLYPPVKMFLERHGFAVKGEVRGCDVVAVREGEPPKLVIAELKLAFSFELVLQAVDRMRAADEVWLAVPATRRGRDRDRRAHRLCRLLGIGLLAVDIRCGGVEVLVEAAPY